MLLFVFTEVPGAVVQYKTLSVTHLNTIWKSLFTLSAFV